MPSMTLLRARVPFYLRNNILRSKYYIVLVDRGGNLCATITGH